ncbi:hypothetical protein M3Y94_00242900 [Aphelenchoides besseyi]|nr:hypothetical protein M3Y94_00242900 [Aphelenchoides besseyi]KAI6236331.1 Rabenosyn-5 [Aphelenchoides besseyi]
MSTNNKMGVIYEGFLCPFCMQDQGNIENLQRHVDEEHSESNVDAIHLIKGVFGAAKRRLNEIDFARGFSTDIPAFSGVQETVIVEKPQVLGISNRHSELFLQHRKHQNEEAEQLTNTLIIRLDKLINEMDDAGDRKEYEKRTMKWMDDSNSPYCSLCTAKFSLTKRHHHCRLCRSLICSSCSRFLSFVSARKLINPAYAAYINVNTTGANGSTMRRSSSSFLSAGINTSLQMVKSKTERLFTSILNENNVAENPEETLRICRQCEEYLKRREIKMDLNSAPSVFVDLYDRLCQLITQITNLAPSFRRMAHSLQNGESLYSLESAIQLRKKLVSVQREITDLSERIEQWGLDSDPAASRRPTPREMIVQKNIRILAITALQDAIMNMPDIPNQAEYNQLHEEYNRRMKAEQIRENRLQSRGSNPTLNRTTRNSPPAVRPPLKTNATFLRLDNDSWTPEPSPQVSNKNPFFEHVEPEEEMHPFVQQYLIIKGYLKQAAEHGRHEEVLTLESNLQALEVELKKLEIATPRAQS